MKSMTEMRESATHAAGAVGTVGKKAAYAVVGAPLVAKKRLTEASGKWRSSARHEFDAWVTEGERLTAEVRKGKVVEEIRDKVDFDQLQGRVEKLRDQLEDVLANWRSNFKPEKPAAKPATTAKKPAAKPTAAKTTTAKKPTAKKNPVDVEA